jgi:c-di-GMP-binding flagellar brake protein YcgR
MEHYIEKQRMVDVLESGQMVELQSGIYKIAGKVASVLSDGGQLKTVIKCSAEDAAGLRLPCEATVSFSRLSGRRSFLYSFESSILEMSAGVESDKLIIISLPDTLTRTEYRTNFRIMISVNGRFLLAEKDGEMEIPFITKDFSAGGIRMLCADMLETGKIGSVVFDIPGSAIPPFAAEVVRSAGTEEGHWMCSLRFMDMKVEHEDLLYNLIREWERGIKAFGKRKPFFRV